MWVEEGKRAAAVVLAGAIWRRCMWCGMEEGKGWGLVIGESQPHNVCLSQLAPVVVVRLVIRVVIITALIDVLVWTVGSGHMSNVAESSLQSPKNG